MPSLRRLNKDAGTNFRRWSEVTTSLKTQPDFIAMNQSIIEVHDNVTSLANEVSFLSELIEISNLTPESEEFIEAVTQQNEAEPPDLSPEFPAPDTVPVEVVTIPEQITHGKKLYDSVERLHRWNPFISKHLTAIPLTDVLTALELDSFNAYDTLWIERIDKVSNVYYTFENEDNEYENFLIPMPNDWGLLREAQPENMSFSSFIDYFPQLKYDVRYRHIAPLLDINRVLKELDKEIETDLPGLP